MSEVERRMDALNLCKTQIYQVRQMNNIYCELCVGPHFKCIVNLIYLMMYMFNEYIYS